MKLTITIPNRNRDWFLDRSIYLLSKQTLPQEYWELIIVDDGSTDYSDDVITKYKKMGIIKNFHYIRNTKKREKSGNCAITRNIGAKFGTGDYILFTDPEVMMMPDWALQHYLAHKVDIVIRPGTGFYIPAVSISSLDIVSSCNLPDTTNRDVIGYCLQPRYYHVVDRDNVKNCQGRLLGDAYNDYDWRDIVGTWNSMENKIKNVQKKFVLSDNQILSEFYIYQATQAGHSVSRKLFFDIRGFEENYANPELGFDKWGGEDTWFHSCLSRFDVKTIQLESARAIHVYHSKDCCNYEATNYAYKYEKENMNQRQSNLHRDWGLIEENGFEVIF